MKALRKKIIAAVGVCFVALAFTGGVLAAPIADVGGSSSASVSAPVRPDDRAGVRGVVYAHVAQPVSERSFGGNQYVQTPSVSSGSEYNWNKTIGISGAALALALCLAGLGLVGMRQHKTRLSV
jgi:hypothetical protein